ncbi:MAG: hypothetical protein IPI44_09800 [Sulfuritalea sp.]|nr:hypothetical protein [Sulfuritalea sp.]
MQAIKMTVEIHNNRLAADLPIPLPDGAAEVIVLYETPQDAVVAGEPPLVEFFAGMDRRPPARNIRQGKSGHLSRRRTRQLGD